MIKTADFNPKIDTKLLCTCGHELCDQRSVSQEHLNRVQIARTIDGIHKTSIGDHPKCQGLDVGCNGSTRGNIVNAGIKSGCNAIGVAKTFVHLGYRDELPEGHITMWVY
jgi:hypothetical protein